MGSNEMASVAIVMPPKLKVASGDAALDSDDAYQFLYRIRALL